MIIMSNFIFDQENPWASGFVLLFPLFLLTFLLIKKWFNPSKSTLNPPPSPPKLPIIGNLHQIGLNPHRSLQALSQKHGPLMLLHLGNVPLLVVSSADAAREIMKTHDPIFSNRPKSSVASGIYDCKDIAFSPYGEYWRQVKSICVYQLLSNRRVQSFRHVREEEVGVTVEKIKESCFGNSEVNLGEIFASLTNDVICRVALGRKYSDGEGGRKFKEVLETLGKLLGGFDVGEFIPWLGWMKYVTGMDSKVKRVAKDLDEFLQSVVQMHIDEKKKREEKRDGSQDFVDVLLDIQKKNETGFPLDGISIKALILDMFAAGTDTTFTILEWAMSELIRHDHVMKKLKKEVRNVAGSKSSITEDDLDKLQYLKAVIKETLRLHTPLPLLIPRESTQDVKLFGYDIATGTRVIINVWAIARDPSSWENPDKFCPERFLNSSIDFKGQHFELIPFGAGRRSCPGAAFAMGIAELALANLVVNFHFSLAGGVSGENLDMTEGDGITVHKKVPLSVFASFNPM